MDNIITKIENANKEAVIRMLSSRPMLIDIKTAGEWMPEMKENELFHAGPPIKYADMCESQKGAVIGAVLVEGLAKSPEEAEKLCLDGSIVLSPNHHHNGIGGMSGVVTRCTPLYIFKDFEHGHYAYAGCLTDRIIFGGYDQKALDNAKWINTVFAPAMGEAIRLSGGIDIKAIQAKALHLGDELHNRSNGGTAEFVRQIAPYLIQVKTENLKEIMEFLANFDPYFLFLSYGACKTISMAAENIEYCSLITTMSRNGVEFGIRVSGLGDQWFTGQAGKVFGPTFPGYKIEDAERDLGDSAITETVGLGAFIMVGAPAILRIIGGKVSEARRYTEDMYRITVAENPNYSIPALDFRGAPLGIDIRKIAEENIVPIIDTAMAHVERGVGEMIGAGIVTLPMEPFEKSLIAFGEKYLK